MTFVEGLKNSLKLDQVSTEVTSRLDSAKRFLVQQQQNVSQLSSVKAFCGKACSLVPNNVSSYIGNIVKLASSATWKRQSPIDIISSLAVYDPILADCCIKTNYFAHDFSEVINTGLYWQISLKSEAQSSNAGDTFSIDLVTKKHHHKVSFSELKIFLRYVTFIRRSYQYCIDLEAGHLTSVYKLRQIHCHWGTEPMNGSEHTVGGVGYAGELHFVHVSAECSSWEEALKSDEGVAILAVFLNETHDDNAAFDPLIRRMEKIRYKGQKDSLIDGFNASMLLPSKTSLLESLGRSEKKDIQ